LSDRVFEISEELVRELSWLAKVGLSESEVRRLVRELDVLLGYISEIVELSVGEEELLYPNPEGHLREDVASSESRGRKHIAGAIEENGFVKAPRVISE